MSAKAERARNLRYKRPALAMLGYEFILNELYDICSECETIRYAWDDDNILEAMDGEEEDFYEFQMMFSDLSAEADQLYDILQDSQIEENFDDCTVALMGNRFECIGYDTVEEDYFGLCHYESELAQTVSGKRVMQLTKKEMLSVIGQCISAMAAFWSIRERYDRLEAVFGILKDDNHSIIETVKEIEKAYNEFCNEGCYEYSNSAKQLDRLCNALPDRAWIM